MSPAGPDEALGRVRDLAEALRAAGVPVGTGRLLSLAQAAAAVPPDDLYWAARATLISRREDLAAFHRAFASVFGLPDRPLPRPQPVADRRRRVLTPSDLAPPRRGTAPATRRCRARSRPCGARTSRAAPRTSWRRWPG